MKSRVGAALCMLWTAFWLEPAHAADLIATTDIFRLASHRFTSGRVLKDLEIGYEVFGTLNAAGDNAVFIPRSFSANSHVAGKFTPADPSPGAWDGLIGPGKLFDTNRYFVVASSSIAALPYKLPGTVTTGPASIDPDSGKPYGARFPIYTIRDMVEIDKKLLDSLGVKRVHTLFGVSMGSMQGFEMAVAYPDFVEHLLAVLPMPQADGYLAAWMSVWSGPILNDPAFLGGDYYQAGQPRTGLLQSLNILHLHQRNRGFGADLGTRPIDPSKPVAAALGNGFLVEDVMTKSSLARASVYDANSVVLGARAMAMFSPGGAATLEEAFAAVKAKVMLVPAASDILFFPGYSQRARDVLAKLGKSVTYVEIPGDGGHYDGVFHIDAVAREMADFMAR